MIDIFLGVTAYSLQNHLRAFAKGRGQLEIDELYVGLNTNGAQFIIPVQAKGIKDKLSVVQVMQDITYCEQQFSELICRPIAAQRLADDKIALFELMLQDDEVKIKRERHYTLVPASDVTPEDLKAYRSDS